MTADEFTAASIALLRSAVGWQSAIARRLRCTDRQVRRWLQSRRIPDWVAERFAEMTRLRDNAGDWPRDEWILGDGIGGPGGMQCEYIVHAVAPRFIARVVETDEDTGQLETGDPPADLLSGVVYDAGFGTTLCEIVWIDEPDPKNLTALMEAASDAIERAVDVPE
jgi:hypothetical protein